MHRCDRVAGTVYQMGGILGDYLNNVSERWLKAAPSANPGMLEMFRDRDRRPLRPMVPWAGEFAGKYLTSAVQALRLTGDPVLKYLIAGFVRELVSLQADNGYLGPWPVESGLTNDAPNCQQDLGTWDTWGHYHVMLGLLLWHADTGDAAALECARRIADRLCEMYLGATSPRLVDTGWSEMNLAPAHSLALVHKVTGEQRYLQLAEQLVAEFAAVDGAGRPLAGNYLAGTLAGLEFFELPKPRWESLHPIMALAELYTITGNVRYRDAFQRIWWSITGTDRHNTGGFTANEAANGDPYDVQAIETCCTIAWIALTVEMLRLTGDARVADELELSTLNSVVGLQSVSGRWVTYNTPADGKRSSCLNNHARPDHEGIAELSCCSVNGARGFGMVSDWALMKDDDGLLLNWYGPSDMIAPLNDTVDVTLRQTTEYPYDGRVELSVSPSAPAAFCLKLRIPRWSTETRVTVNGESIADVQPGRYLSICREWQAGDTVVIDLDLTLHFWTGENARAGLTSIYRGPILLAYDRRYNDMDPDDLPALDARDCAFQRVEWSHWLPPAMLLEFTAVDGRKVRLCDFGSAGEAGTPYKSWLEVEHVDGTRPQFFAPEPDQRLRAELGRYAVRYASIPGLGHTGNNPQRRALIELRNDWAAFAQNCAAAREKIDADPDAPASRSLAAALARLACESDVLDPTLPDRLDRELAQADPEPLCALTDCRVSELRPAAADIRQVALPATTDAFRPIQSRDRNDWFDVTDAHNGQDGLLYVCVTANMRRAARAPLAYGADGPVKVWVNGREVGCKPDADTPAAAREYAADADWQEGENAVVFALNTNGGKAWGVHVALPQA